MKIVKKISDKKILVQFKEKDKPKFFELLNQVKTITGRRYDSNLKAWIVPNNDKNIEILKNLGFELNNVFKLDSVSLILTNNLIIIKSSLTTLVCIQEFFTFDNYSYCYSRSGFDRNKIIKVSMLKIEDSIGHLPFGFFKILRDFLIKNKVSYDLFDNRKHYKIEYSYDKIKNILPYLELYDYQIEAIIKCITQEIGIVKLPTGSGKTEIFLALCKILNLKTLILFNRITLAQQTLQRANKAKLDVGIVQGGNIDEKHQIVMCTVQSSNKLKQKYDVIIVDECHRSSGNQYEKVLKNRSFRYKFGFSATPFVKDEYKKALVKKWLGAIIYEVPVDFFLKQNRIATPYIYFIELKNNVILEKIFDWEEIEKFGIIQNEYRNEEIKKLCDKIQGSTMILVKKIKHGKILESIIENSVFIFGDTVSDIRDEYIKRFENNEKITLIASTIFDEGISINNIRNLIIAGGGKSEIKTIQRLGRGLRIKEGKTTVDVYDFYDTTNPILEKHSNERIKTYQEAGFDQIKKI